MLRLSERLPLIQIKPAWRLPASRRTLAGIEVLASGGARLAPPNIQADLSIKAQIDFGGHQTIPK
jgi:hypothetical protein